MLYKINIHILTTKLLSQKLIKMMQLLWQTSYIKAMLCLEILIIQFIH